MTLFVPSKATESVQKIPDMKIILASRRERQKSLLPYDPNLIRNLATRLPLKTLGSVEGKKMFKIVRFGTLALVMSALAGMSEVATAQIIPAASQPSQQRPSQQRPSQQRPSQQRTSKICSFDSVSDSLPPPASQQTNSASALSYLQEQGFTQNPDGSWVCYVNDPRKEGRYYTLFKVQEVGGKLVASSFLENGSLIEGQDSRSLDFFMMLIGNHRNTNEGNRESIRRYLETFISKVRAGTIPASRRGYLFDQPSRGIALHHPLTGGKLKGTAITINFDLQQKLRSSPVPETNFKR